MLVDVVLDTNVLLHADNDIEPRQADAVELLTKLLGSDTAVAVDEGFDLDESKNRSLIGQEYLTKLTPLSFGYLALTELFSSGRFLMTKRSADATTRNRVNQLLRNRRDRTFLLVALNTHEQVFCSHDFRDFSTAKRNDIRRQLAVAVEEANVVVTML
jgi:hypothetical protein